MLKKMFPSSPKRRRTMTGKEDISGLFKFYGIQKREGQSMSSFYADLRLQADKIGGKDCCVEEKIRDRLLLANKDLVAELAGKRNPSISDVLAADEKVEKDRQVWTLILPHLSMVEIARVFHTSIRLKKVVSAFLKGNNSVTVSGQLIADYPIEENEEFFSKIEHVQDVTVEAGKEEDLERVLSRFNSIKILSLLRMIIIEKVDYLPKQLTDLKLIYVQIEEKLLQEWLAKLKETLQSLHLENITTSFMQSKEMEVYLKESCPNLRSLTIIGDTVTFMANPKNLKGLHIETRNELCCEIEAYIQLETLNLAVPKSTSVDWKKFTKLQSLTMKHWLGTVPQSVEDLRIIYPQDPKHRPQIEALKELKTVQISYHPQEEEEQDLILNKLNTYCLLELTKYLSLKDRISFAYTHSKLFKLITENCCRKMIMVESNVEFLKDNKFFCKRAAPHINLLSIKEDCQDIHWIVPLCTSLNELYLVRVELTTDFINSWPSKLASFGLQYEYDSEDRRTPQSLARYLGKLIDIDEFGFDCTIAEDALKDCFERNQDTLKSILLHYNGENEMLEDYDWSWASCALLPKVDTINLQYNYTSSPLPPHHMELMFSSLGPQLKSLTVAIGIHDFREAINGRLLPNLQELKLMVYLESELPLSATDLSGLSSLVKLTKLTCTVHSDFKTFKWMDSDILHLIKSLPEFENLQIDVFKSTLLFQKQLKDYIKREGRTLVFNGHYF